MPYLLNNVVSYYPWVKKTRCLFFSVDGLVRSEGAGDFSQSRRVCVVFLHKQSQKSGGSSVIQGRQKQNKQVISTIPLFSVIGHWLWKRNFVVKSTQSIFGSS